MGCKSRSRPARLDERFLGLVVVLISAVWLSRSSPVWSQSSEDGDASVVEGASAEPEILPPVLVHAEEAQYPASAFQDDVEADVVVQIDISSDGEVSNVVVLELIHYVYDDDGVPEEYAVDVTEDPYGFVPSAVSAIEAYTFLPARLVDVESGEETVISVQVTWRIGFIIDEVPDLDVDAAESDEDVVVEVVGVDPDGEVNFSGRLLKRGTRQPLSGLVVQMVYLSGSDDDSGDTLAVEEITGADGRFAFRGLPDGMWRVRTGGGGFFEVETDERVDRALSTEVTYFIERNIFGENVSRTTVAPPEREVTRRALQVQEIQRIPGNNNDAIRVVQNLPGVARPAFGGGDVIVRGSSAQDTGFYLDGMEIPALYHFGGIRAVFPTEFIEEINFYPGGFGSDYGRATGGVVDVTTNMPDADRVTGHVDVNLFDTGVFLQGPIGERLTYQVAARRSYIDAILAPLSDTLGLNFSTAPRWYDYQARLIYRPNRQHTISLFFYGSDDLIDLVRQDEEGIDPSLRGQIRAQAFFYGALLRIDSRLTDTLTSEFRLQLMRQGFDFVLGDDLFFDLKVVSHSYRETLIWRPTEQFTLRGGLDIVATPKRIALSVPRPPKEGEEALDFAAAENVVGTESFSVYTPAMFIGAEVEAAPGLRLIPGARLDYFRPTGRWAANGRLGVRYALLEEVTVKGSVGNYAQAPQPDEFSRTFGNPRLELIQAIHYVVGTEWQLAPFLEVGVELFFKDLQNLVTRSNEVEIRGEDVSPVGFANDGVGRVFGAEFLVRHELNNRFFGWIAYTLSRSERRDSPESPWRLFDFDQTHILTALGSYQLPKNWSVGVRFRLVSGNPDTPIVGSTFDARNNTYIRIPGAPNSVRQPLFHQLDVRVDKRWIRDRYTMNLYLDVQNAYNQGNQENVIYSYDYAESEPLTGLPIIPAFGFRVEF